MDSIKYEPLSADLPFGASIRGVNRETLRSASVREQLKKLFDEHGVLVFKGMEPSPEVHLELSAVFGPLQHHALAEDQGSEPEAVDLKQQQDIVELDGRKLGAYLPWHFDACYTARLNRAALLRPVEIPPEGGMTGFVDGIQLYHAISPSLREKFEGKGIIYDAKLMFMNQRFGVPKNQRWISISPSAEELIGKCDGVRRAIHPAIWTRSDGENVLHVSPWQAAAIHEAQNPQGDALLEELCSEIYAKMIPYWHAWEMEDMVLWDNWRLIHSVSGNDPDYGRHMQRATIGGDYGLGFFEEGREGQDPPEMG